MVELNSVVTSTSKFITIEYISVVIVGVILAYIVTLINNIRKVGKGDKGKIVNKIIVSLVILTVPITAFVVTVTNHSKIINENIITREDTLRQNIALLLGKNKGKEKGEQLTLKEIETYIELNSKYFMGGRVGGVQTVKNEYRTIEDNVKRYVFEEYGRDTPLYKELILESNKMFN